MVGVLNEIGGSGEHPVDQSAHSDFRRLDLFCRSLALAPHLRHQLRACGKDQMRLRGSPTLLLWLRMPHQHP
jgi:hypothetical protein